MALMTGEQYLESMRKLNLQVYMFGEKIENPVDDTLQLSRLKLKGLPSYKLGYLTDYFSIALNDAHRAWCDAEATANLYLKLQAV